jgi:hypothetical protein
MLDNENLDKDIRDAVVWSLSQIGGEDVRETIEKLIEDSEDDEEADYLGEVLDNLNFTEGFDLVDLMDFDEDDEGPTNNGNKPSKNNWN